MKLLDELKRELTYIDLARMSKELNLNIEQILNRKRQITMPELLKIIDYINPSIEKATLLIKLFKNDYKVKFK